MAVPAGRALFKKKDGILTLTSDLQTVTWTPNSGGPPTISLPVAGITSMFAPILLLFPPLLTENCRQTFNRRRIARQR